MPKHLAVALSLIANVALIGYVLAPTGNATRSAAPDSAAILEHARGSPNPERSNGATFEPAAYRARLLEYGLSEEEIARLVLAHLEQLHIEPIREPPDRYWELESDLAVEYRKALEDGRDLIRRELLALYGESARKSRVFAPLFRPLDPGLHFLTSEEQLTIVRANLEPSADEALEGVLDASGLFEYKLRTSPLARRLRQSGVEFTESQFRATFELMDEYQRNPHFHDFASYRESLRRVLGRDGFLRLWSATDPAYGVLATIGEEEGLTSNKVFAAYEVLQDAQDALASIGRTAAGDPRPVAERVREIVTSRQRRLAELVGEESATKILSRLNSGSSAMVRVETAVAR